MSVAVTFGTRVWIADLIRAGWTASVSEHRPVGREKRSRYVVREVVTGPARVGVLLRDASGEALFVPTVDEAAARELLEAALEEAE